MTEERDSSVAPLSADGERNSVLVAPLLDREQAVLAFNRRVLAQAERDDVPLLERLRYITIVSSNLDEFFEVRFADYHETVGATAAGPAALAALADAAHALIDAQYALFNDRVMPALAAAGVRIVNHAERSPAQRRWVARFFEQQVRPLLVPIGLDPAHPFPQVANKSLNFIARLSGRDAFGRESGIAIVKVPRVLPRVIRLPASLCKRGEQGFVLLSSVIRAHLGSLFAGRKVDAFSQFRVTRDSDLEVDEDDVANLRQALRMGLTTRHFGRAIRIEVANTCPAELSQFLLQQFALPEAALYRVNGPVNLVRLAQLIDQASGGALHFAPFEPAWPAGLARGASIFAHLRTRGDVLLHHPFESFEPVVAFLREAVHDPDVLAIQQTVYRTGADSVLMELLLDAVRRGKEVTVVLELKARFDEEANINWAERLEAVGAQVLYGVVGLKTHAKLLLVTRREQRPRGSQHRDPVLVRYVHLSTGNYNTRSARLYTDLGLLTADATIAADVDAVFQQLAHHGRLHAPRRLLAAPFQLHRRLVGLVARVAEAARAGRTARIVVKCNALTDAALIEALQDAGRAGARIDLLVRGACLLPLADVSGDIIPTIQVRSVVGRLLEHSRVFYFRWGETDADEALYLSSADWMGRNMFRRVEIAWPIDDPTQRQRVIDEALVPYLRDTRDAWVRRADGRYARIDADGVSAQQALLERFRT